MFDCVDSIPYHLWTLHLPVHAPNDRADLNLDEYESKKVKKEGRREKRENMSRVSESTV